jgi:hypothetical protein
VLSGRGLCDELISRPEESYRLWCVVICNLETSRMRRTWPALGHSATAKRNLKYQDARHEQVTNVCPNYITYLSLKAERLSSTLANTASSLCRQFIKLPVLHCEAVDRNVVLCFTSRRGPYVTLTASLPRATLFHATHRNSSEKFRRRHGGIEINQTRSNRSKNVVSWMSSGR